MSFNSITRKYQKLRDSARGEECTLQLHPYCNGDPETTVLCHLSSDSGMGQKSPDFLAVYGCSDCHDIIDGRKKVSTCFLLPEDIEQAKMRSLHKTWLRFIEKGLISVA